VAGVVSDQLDTLIFALEERPADRDTRHKPAVTSV
jgi:hypothetical protein